MPFSNLAYLYDHLPARFRREDQDLFLKRFLSVFGEELDRFDNHLDTFYQKIDPATAPEAFIDFWLYNLFGWGWFPTWFTLERKRAFYASIATHYARRGTARGIKEFLSAFGLHVEVVNRSPAWNQKAWGQGSWTISGPLGFVVRLFPEADAVPETLSFWKQSYWNQSVAPSTSLSVQRADVDELLRFVWPLSQIILIEDVVYPVS